jgi:hypothetical protein
MLNTLFPDNLANGEKNMKYIQLFIYIWNYDENRVRHEESYSPRRAFYLTSVILSLALLAVVLFNGGIF